ncbi:phosphotransferase [Sporosarcina sp. ACRSL]|uniref:phosphotransferase enzyme family protein n=1 Tax=Sporosarcina sp. ACRSL TaxID=2918215 RepID=UPI001EF66D11|nr:phosphotransferase [Sporosarcina sp. ACRSL]MCG7343648.1 phosphotransferase [Sporosarcina sp. ACRSL]
MMKLSIMRDFLESDASEVLVHSLLENWGFEQDSVQFLRASSNFVFVFERNGEKHILRLTPNGDRNQLLEEVSFLTFLARNNVSLNVPILSKNGNMVEETNSELGIFQAVVFRFLSGAQYEIEELSERHFFLWGEALGNLHNCSKQFVKKNSVQNDLVQQLAELDGYLPQCESLAREELESIKTWLKTLEINKDNYGVIHYDFELDNLIWDGDNVQMIDFESSMGHWYTADIAFALRDLFNDNVDFSSNSFQTFLKGYRSKVNVTDKELNAIPMFLRLHNLITFTGLLRTVDVEKDVNHPQWIEGLRKKLELKIDDYRDGFKQRGNS